MKKKTLTITIGLSLVAVLAIMYVLFFGADLSFVSSDIQLHQYAGTFNSDNAEGAQGMVSSMTSQIDGYTITTEKTSYASNNEGEGISCWGKYKIVKDGEIIYQTSDWSKKTYVYNDSSLTATFRTTFYKTVSQDCGFIMNSFRVQVPEDSFNVTFKTDKNLYIKGDNITFDVIINNDYGKEVSAKLHIDLNIPTDVGNASTSEDRMINLTEGENKFTYKRKTVMSTDKLIIRAKMDVLVPGSRFTGVNANCYGTEGSLKPANTCQFIKIGSTEEIEQVINILDRIPSVCIDAGKTSITSCESYIESKMTVYRLNLTDKTNLIDQLEDVTGKSIDQIIKEYINLTNPDTNTTGNTSGNTTDNTTGNTTCDDGSCEDTDEGLGMLPILIGVGVALVLGGLAYFYFRKK